MNTLQLNITDKLATITLDRGRANAINAEMVAELTETIKNLEADDQVRGVLLAGKENFFSAGLDLIELYDYDEDKMRRFWLDFLHLHAAMFNFSKPLVAAITGHSPAGGCVMAVCCDYRVMAKGKYIIGLNEVQVGIVVPRVIFENYAFWIGRRKAYQYLMEGKLLSVDQAFNDGLIDEICEPDEVLKAAENKALTLMKFGRSAWRMSKQNLREGVLPVNSMSADAVDLMMKQWWSAETRQTLQAVIQNLKSPQKA